MLQEKEWESNSIPDAFSPKATKSKLSKAGFLTGPFSEPSHPPEADSGLFSENAHEARASQHREMSGILTPVPIFNLVRLKQRGDL